MGQRRVSSPRKNKQGEDVDAKTYLLLEAWH